MTFNEAFEKIKPPVKGLFDSNQTPLQNARDLFRLLSVITTSLIAVASILYALGLSPVSNMQLDEKLRMLTDINNERMATILKTRDDRIDSSFNRLETKMVDHFVTNEQLKEYSRAMADDEKHVNDIDTRVNHDLSSRLNTLESLIARIDERTKATYDTLSESREHEHKHTRH